MDKSRIKNLIIIVLLLVNVFLAGIVISDSAQSRAYASASDESLMEALKNSGITLADRSLLNAGTVPSCSVSRDLSREKRQVSSVIGSVQQQDQGGNIVMYYGNDGQACFRGTGDFEILMENATVPVGDDPARTSENFLKKIGIDIDADTAQVKYSSSGASCTVTAMCLFEGRPIVNCLVTLNYSDTNLLLVSGTRPLTDASESASGSEMDAATAVMRLIAMLDDSGYLCSSITDVGHCYKMDVSASGTGTLTPLWRFSTDIGDFYINGITGKTETVTQNN